VAITADDVFGWLGANTAEPADATTPTDLQVANMETVVAAVIAHIAKHYTAPEDPEEGEDADWTLGHIIAAAKLYQRTKSPNGIIDLGEMGGLRITSVDRDAEALLGPYKNFAMG
jgi:hypothetical protein